MPLIVFCDKVDQLVKQQYGLDDGGDLCFNLVQSNVISLSDSVAHAARIVAMHFVQA